MNTVAILFPTLILFPKNLYNTVSSNFTKTNYTKSIVHGDVQIQVKLNQLE